MNASNITPNQTFIDFVQRERLARLPYGVVVLIFYVIGIIGNSHVIHIFRRMPRKKTPSEAIIFVLAMFDLITMVLFIAKEYERMRYVMKNNFEIVCKISNYFGFAAGLSSSLFVLVLAIYRYQRVFHPRTMQTTVPKIIIKLVGCCVISAILSIPVPFIVGFQSFQVEGYQISRCWFAEEQVFESLPKVYFISLLVFSSVNCLVMGLCYLRIAKVLYRLKSVQENQRELTACQREQTETSIVLDIINNEDNLSEKSRKSGSNRNVKENMNTKETKMDSAEGVTNLEATDDRKYTEAKAKMKNNSNSVAKNRILPTPTVANSHLDEKKAECSSGEESVSRNFRFTLMILVISITVMLSYILFLSLYIFMVFKRAETSFILMTVREDVFYTYATDVVAVNAVVNPFVYFFSDRGYREMVKSIYKRK